MMTHLTPTFARSLWSMICEAWWDAWLEMWDEIDEQVDARSGWTELEAACGVRKPDAPNLTSGHFTVSVGGVWSELDQRTRSEGGK